MKTVMPSPAHFSLEYSSTAEVRDVLRHYEKLSFKDDALETLKNSRECYPITKSNDLETLWN